MLDGKAALVTGAGRGIGRGIALALAREGARVVVNDLGVSLHGEGGERSPAQQVVDEIELAGGEAIPNYDSVADFDAATAMVQQTVDAFGRIDILVNVAGILRDRMIFNMTEEEFDSVVAVHLKGSFNCTRAACIQMREQQSGRIISMSSPAALGSAGQPNYGSAKAGIIGLMWSTALGMGRYSVTANSIIPTAATRMTDSTPRGQKVFEETGKWPSELAVGTQRDPDNVAPLVVYLASDHAAGITGQTFYSQGFSYGILEQPRAVRAIQSTERWDVHDLARVFPETLGKQLDPPTGSTFMNVWNKHDEGPWTDLGGGRRYWESPRAEP
jgi:NAD(P)-dependent dehydrogenase (short-subunit alcohol dehydrogenase family)